MNTLKTPLTIEKLLSPQYKRSTGDRKISQFLVWVESAGSFYLFHTLTGGLYVLSPKEADVYNSLDILTINRAAHRSGINVLHSISTNAQSAEEWISALGKPLYNALCTAHFLIPADSDEAYEYHYLLKLEKLLHPSSEGYDHFTILPTTACNARCFYCFENGYRSVSLNVQQVEGICSMIERTRSAGTVHLRWFGGEPLLGTPSIRKICQYLSERTIPFDSYIVTNGLLFTPSLVSEAVESWNLHSAQITLDGTQKEYERRKAYVPSMLTAGGTSPFQIVLQNLHHLHDAGVRLVLRLNADPRNVHDLSLLLQQLTEEFPDRRNIKIYASPLFEEYSVAHEDPLALVRQCLDLNLQAHQAGFKTNHPYSLDAFRTHMCMADDVNSIVISADGRLTHCEDCRENTFFGNCTEGITDTELYGQLRNPIDRHTACEKCAFLPRCTDYPNCPHEKPESICKEIIALRLQYSLNLFLSTI